MPRSATLLPFLAAFVTACTSHLVDERPGTGPYAAGWLKEQIADFESGAAASTNRVEATVVFNGTSLYLIRSPCCDLFDYLYTADGKAFCAPSGGFAGGGDHKCPPNLEPVRRRGD